MEKELEQIMQAVDNSNVLYEKMCRLFMSEKPKNFEVVLACVEAIANACADKLIMPQQNFVEMLLQIIDFHTEE